MAKVKYTKAQKARKRRRRIRQLRGAIFLLFAFIGMLAIASLVIGKLRTVTNDDEQKQEFAKIIAPLVAMDPVPFESVDKANPEMLKQTSIWAVIYNENTSKYLRNESDQLLIPAVDVDRYFRKLFGEGTLPEHSTFTVGDLTFEFDEETQSYVIPITSLSSPYYPRVTDIDSSGSTKTLTVEYLSYSDQPGIVVVPGGDDGVQVVKKMEYILLKDGSEYRIYSVRYPSKN